MLHFTHIACSVLRHPMTVMCNNSPLWKRMSQLEMGLVKYSAWTWGKNWSIEVKMRFWVGWGWGEGGHLATRGPRPWPDVNSKSCWWGAKRSACNSDTCRFTYQHLIFTFPFFSVLLFPPHPYIFSFFSFVALLYVAVLYSTFFSPLQRLNYFSLLSSICFPFCTLCQHRFSSLLFRIYLPLYFLFFFLFSAFWRSFASLFFPSVSYLSTSVFSILLSVFYLLTLFRVAFLPFCFIFIYLCIFYSSFCFLLFDALSRRFSSLLFRIYLPLYFLFFFLFSAFWRSFASLFFFILFRFVPLFVVDPFSSLPCYPSALYDDTFWRVSA